MNQSGNKYESDLERRLRKLRILMACWATVTLVVMIIAIVLVSLGIGSELEHVFSFPWMPIGVVGIFVVSWPFFEKRLK